MTEDVGYRLTEAAAHKHCHLIVEAVTVVANANKMARIVWALLTREEDYKAPAPIMA